MRDILISTQAADVVIDVLAKEITELKVRSRADDIVNTELRSVVRTTNYSLDQAREEIAALQTHNDELLSENMGLKDQLHGEEEREEFGYQNALTILQEQTPIWIYEDDRDYADRVSISDPELKGKYSVVLVVELLKRMERKDISLVEMIERVERP